MTAPNTIADHCRWLRAEAEICDDAVYRYHYRADRLRAIAEVLEGKGEKPFYVITNCVIHERKGDGGIFVGDNLVLDRYAIIPLEEYTLSLDPRVDPLNAQEITAAFRANSIDEDEAFGLHFGKLAHAVRDAALRRALKSSPGFPAPAGAPLHAHEDRPA